MPAASEKTSTLRWDEVPRRAWEVLREQGFRSLWFHILGETAYRRMVLFERPLSDPIPSAAAAVPVEISLLRPADVAEYVAFHPGIDAVEVRERLEHCGKCFIARHQGAIVNACWTAEGLVWIDYLGCSIQLAPGEAYVYNNYTDPRFRGRNIPPVRAAEMLRHFRNLGYRRFIALVVPENRAALRPPEKAGYRRIGAIGRLQMGPWRHHFLSAWHRRDHLA